MKKIKKNIVLFATGGVGYAMIELLWRGRTHWTMIIAGGICFVIFSKIAQKYKRRRLLFKAALCAIAVTAVEFAFGVVFNLILKMNVWDYSRLPFNFLGQICLIYTLIWGALGMIFIPLAEAINRKMKI